MEQVTLNVKGMSCSSCINSIEGSVGKLQGVESVKVRIADGKVDVGFDALSINLDTIVSEIEEQGYDVER